MLATTADPWQKIATPTRFAATVGKEFLGRPYRPYPWLLKVEKRILDAIVDPAQRFIILNVPPQNGKTTTFGLFLPTWYLGMYPMNQVIFVAYNQEYAESWGLKCRNLLERYGPSMFGVGISKQQTATGNWKTDQGFGGMLSAGILGGITGNPGHLIIIDDVIKTMEEASSPTLKKKHLDEFDGAIATRFQEADGDQPGTTVIVTATRFAEDDLTGRLIERQNKPGYTGDRWEVLSIPAIAEAPDDADEETWRDPVLGRRHGEGLEGRFSLGHYLKRRETIDPFTFAALYQQSPASVDGGMFPKARWKLYQQGEAPRMRRTVRAWDLAATEDGGDHTAGMKWGVAPNGDVYLLDIQRGQWSSATVEDTVKATARGDGFETKVMIEQEKAGAGKALFEHYQRLLRGHTVIPAKVDGNKEARARPYSAMQLSGRCFLPAWRPEVRAFIEEHAKMMGDGRRPRHDDMIDASAYAVYDLISEEGAEMWIPGENPNDAGSQLLAQNAAMRVLRGQGFV